jgi:hypothetical protein
MAVGVSMRPVEPGVGASVAEGEVDMLLGWLARGDRLVSMMVR